ncbi:dimethylaniline monooxygenase-like [Tropilaelaps mercedesae]|uniref:Flavin-containing monooxygenase n=1 Tax=Tropilaelaps mercedesae TaxID=418985 RepID=A0A1V9X7Z9_9ACAR|nr:dimethylaniline monooxygenase-like [Tropilaelaps mercedesae]
MQEIRSPQKPFSLYPPKANFCTCKDDAFDLTRRSTHPYSDFPPPAEFPNYMHNSKMVQYLDLYADKYGMRPYIRTRHDVIRVTPTEDYEQTRRWVVRVKNLESGEESEDVFDGVLVCTGHHTFPQMPTFADQEKFKGRIIHSHDYRRPNGFEDHKVCVVGVGNSGGDVAVELSSIADQVYLSTRRGAWIIHRVGKNGRPFDISVMTRLGNVLFTMLPYSFICWFCEKKVDARFDHELYNIKPSHRIFSQHVMVNDALPNRILSGTVTVKGNIKRFTENGIVFEGETQETPVDDVVLATGYKIKFPFFDDNLISCEDNRIDLYKMVFDPNHPTLAFIGMAQPVGPLMPICEIQSRWVARLLAGKQKLPSKAVMHRSITAYQKNIRARFFEGPRNTIEVDWIPYMDEMATILGVKPNLFKILVTDFQLWSTLMFGPVLPYQYRLEGPGRWSKAREALITAEDRICAALQTRKVPVPKGKPGNTFFELLKMLVRAFFSLIFIVFLSVLTLMI